MVRETGEGLNIEIVAQDGASMFQEGSREPYERIRQLLQMIAGPLNTNPLSA
jgi:chemotaxis protein MotB